MGDVFGRCYLANEQASQLMHAQAVQSEPKGEESAALSFLFTRKGVFCLFL